MSISISGSTGISGVDGSASTPAIQGSDTNTGISFGTDTVNINTGGTTRATVDSSGRFGIGTTSPVEKLTVDGGICARHTSDDSQIKLSHNGTTANIYATYGSTGAYDPLAFFTSDQERARIDSSGRLLLGDASAAINLKYGGSGDFGSRSYVYGANEGFSNGLAVLNYDATATVPALLKLGSSRNDTIGNNTAVGNTGDKIAAIQFMGNDGTRFIDLARIDAETDGTVGSGSMPGRLIFNVTASGGSVVTERMRIKNDGRTVVGDGFSTAYGQVFTAVKIGDTGKYFGIGDQGNSANAWSRDSGTSTYTHIQFANGNGSTGTITTSGTSTAYNTTSDYRLKENVTLLTGATDRLKQLPVHRFNFIVEPDKTVDGFIAHEVQTVVPEAVTGEKDAVDDEGNPVYQGIDQSKLVPLLTAALQEAQARIESLEARLTALEGGAS